MSPTPESAGDGSAIAVDPTAAAVYTMLAGHGRFGSRKKLRRDLGSLAGGRFRSAAGVLLAPPAKQFMATAVRAMPSGRWATP